MLLKYNTMCTQNSYHKICEECGKEFITLMPTTHYCSDRCSKLAYKHRKRDERLNNTTLEVRERQRLALLDKDFLTLSDAARLMQMSRNTLYKIIRDNEIQIKRFTDRTVRIARADLDKASEGRSTGINTTAPGMTDNLGKWMTREQVMEKYDVTYSWFYSTLKKRGVKTHMIGTLGFYDRIDTINEENDPDSVTTKELIEQVYQFSRIYWKSVKQQNLPVTIKYPEMVAEMAPHFNGDCIPEEFENRLWFL